MPAQVETPQKSSRRSRRPSRKSAGPPSSHIALSQHAELSADSEADKHSNQPTRILRRGDPDTISEIAPVVELGSLPPHTPPRPKSIYDGSTYQQPQRHDSAPEIPRNKKRTPKPQGRKQSAPVSSISDIDSTPVSASRRESAPPNHATATPMKAYAGPTFHASPAASSLPIPKFYSKSVPNVDKTKSLKAMMEQEAPDSSSGSEESPFLENVRPFSDPKSREESPLDIFFRADREAKGRTGSTPHVPCSIKTQTDASDSPLGLLKSPRHHSRHSSAGGVFPLEMDGASSEISPGASSLNCATKNATDCSPVNLASSGSNHIDREEQRKAQTLALKKLLYSPRPQISQNGSFSPRPPSSKLRKEIPLPASPDSASTPELPATPTPSLVRKPTTPLTKGPKTLPNGFVSPSHSVTPFGKSNQGRYVISAHETTTTKSIENDLRRILKLDVHGGDGVTGH